MDGLDLSQGHKQNRLERIQVLLSERPQANWSIRIVKIQDKEYEVNFISNPDDKVLRLFVEIEAIVLRDFPNLNPDTMIAVWYQPDVERRMSWASIQTCLYRQRSAKVTNYVQS